jgi:ketosteroid isomerase-like protein
LTPVLQFIEAFNAGDLDAFVGTLDPEIEIHSMKGLRRGLEEARAWATRAPGGVQQTIVVEELRQSEDNVVALIMRQWHWSEGGELVSEEPIAWLFTLRDGKVLRWRPFEDWAEALSAAGIT